MNPIKEGISLDPVDTVAARVLHSRGARYEPVKRILSTTYHSYICPPMRTIQQIRAEGFNGVDLTGRKYGRFTVIGRADWRAMGLKESLAGARWVVRCACGIFETRKAKVIHAAKPENGLCVRCQELDPRNYKHRNTI